MRKLLLLSILLFFARPSFAQGVRMGDNFPITSSLTTPGQISTVSNAIIRICNYPANAVPCSNLATTYTSVTLGTPCSTSIQIVLAGTNTCTGTTDPRGNWGAWLPAGNFDFTVTVSTGQSFGPFTVSAGNAVSGTATNLLGPGSISGIFGGNSTSTGNLTQQGNNSHSGTETFTGTLNANGLLNANGGGAIGGNFSGGPTLSGAWNFAGGFATTTGTFSSLASFLAAAGTPAFQVGSTGMQWSQPSGGWSMDGRPNNSATRGEIRLSCNDTGGVDASCGELTLLNKDLTGASYLAGNKSYMTFFYANSDNRWHTQINAFGTDTLKPWCIDPLAGTFTFCFYNSTISSIGIGGGISKNGVPGIGIGLTHQRTASCTTGATAGNNCATDVTWLSGFVDTNYTVTCSVDSATALPVVAGTSKFTTKVTVTIATLTNAAASGIINCTAMHD